MRRSTRTLLIYAVLILVAAVFVFSQGAPYWVVYATVILRTAQLLLSLVLRHSIRYRFADTGLWILWIFWIPRFRISYSRIKEIEMAFDREWYRTPGDLFPLAFFNKWYGYGEGEGVRIRRKKGRPVLLSPDDPEEFVQELRRRVYEKTGEWPLVS